LRYFIIFSSLKALLGGGFGPFGFGGFGPGFGFGFGALPFFG